jgi:hypothetical protein
MALYHPTRVIGFHSCDREVGLRILNGRDYLRPSNNSWDWLGDGVYFWEENPGRALEYAQESAQRKQFNLLRISTPFVLGAVIDLGSCLNLVERESLLVLGAAYESLKKAAETSRNSVPKNKGSNRALDCAVIKYIHQSNLMEGKSYDTVRCALPEGDEAFTGSAISSRLHIQIAVRNTDCIRGIFLPYPTAKFNPYLEFRQAS